MQQEESSKHKKKVLLLTTSLLTDRMILYSEFLEVLKDKVDLTIWANSYNNKATKSVWQKEGIKVEEFPEIKSLKIFPYTYLRRLNEYVWDMKLKISSRIGIQKNLRDGQRDFITRSLKIPAKILAYLNLHEWLEYKTEKTIQKYNRSPEALKRLRQLQPNIVIVMNPYLFMEPAVVAIAKNLKIPVFAFIPSWDNLSTKNRLVFHYNGIMLWSEEQKRQLHEYYPYTKSIPVQTIGAPQYDVFFNHNYYITKEEFCNTYDLDINLPIVLFAIGSPNFIYEEDKAAID
ncbi:MAG: hypothetical protein NTX03_01870 [Bacteroidetes bacterium]|nr:hypothetical protein [Bacteroidota bacterium]